MALLYARDSLVNGWWNQIELILWGPSVESAAESEAVQQELALLQNLGVRSESVSLQRCATASHRSSPTLVLRFGEWANTSPIF